MLAKEGHYFVVFDDRTRIARISDDLQTAVSSQLLGPSSGNRGYEGIAYNSEKHRFYLLVESCRQEKGHFQAMIIEWDDRFTPLKSRPLDFKFKSSNKGFEAVAYVRRDGRDCLLALCEGNKCQCGAKGRRPGGGRLQLFEKAKKRWRHADTIALPAVLPFIDYSGMSINDRRVAIASQVNSMLWVGEFDASSWTWRDQGQVYEFPRFDDGAIQCGNVEGVAWTGPGRFVAVSDRRKKRSQPDSRLAEKDQSVHIFEIPS